MEPWYNLSRIEQIIGRGIRHKSHCGLSELDRNVEIFLLCFSKVKHAPEQEMEDPISFFLNFILETISRTQLLFFLLGPNAGAMTHKL